jgi:hypothetical protein
MKLDLEVFILLCSYLLTGQGGSFKGFKCNIAISQIYVIIKLNIITLNPWYD